MVVAAIACWVMPGICTLISGGYPGG